MTESMNGFARRRWYHLIDSSGVVLMRVSTKRLIDLRMTAHLEARVRHAPHNVLQDGADAEDVQEHQREEVRVLERGRGVMSWVKSSQLYG